MDENVAKTHTLETDCPTAGLMYFYIKHRVDKIDLLVFCPVEVSPCVFTAYSTVAQSHAAATVMMSRAATRMLSCAASARCHFCFGSSHGGRTAAGWLGQPGL